MNGLSGDAMMKIGWVASHLVVLVFLIFYRSSVSPEVEVKVWGLFVIAWMASSLVYGGAMRMKKRLQQRIAELESSQP